MFVRVQPAPSAAALPLGQTPASGSPASPCTDPFEAFVRRAVSQDAGRSGLPQHADASSEPADDPDSQALRQNPGSAKPQTFAKSHSHHPGTELTDDSAADKTSTGPSKPKAQPLEAADLTGVQALSAVAPALLMSWAAPLQVTSVTAKASTQPQVESVSTAPGVAPAAVDGTGRTATAAATNSGLAAKDLALSAEVGLETVLTESGAPGASLGAVAEMASDPTDLVQISASHSKTDLPATASGGKVSSETAKAVSASGSWNRDAGLVSTPHGGSAEFWSGALGTPVSGADAPARSLAPVQAPVEAGANETSALAGSTDTLPLGSFATVQPQTPQMTSAMPLSDPLGKAAASENLSLAGVDAFPTAKQSSAISSVAASGRESGSASAGLVEAQDFSVRQSAALPDAAATANDFGAKIESAMALSDIQVAPAHNVPGTENIAADSVAGLAASAARNQSAELTLADAKAPTASSAQEMSPAGNTSPFVAPQAAPAEPQAQLDARTSALKTAPAAEPAPQVEVQPEAAPSPEKTPAEKEAGQKTAPGSTQVGKTVSPFGTAAAKEDLSMKMAEKTSKTAELAQQKLPGNGIEGSERQNLTPQAAAPVKSALRTQAAENGALSSAPTVNLATSASTMTAAATTALPGQDSSRLLSLERIHDLASVHAMRLRDSGSDSLRVLIQPGNGIQLSLELRAGEGGIQAQALLNRGDYQFLNSQWSDLQQRLAPQGIHLAPLQCTAGFSGGQSHQQSNGQSTKDEPGAGAFAEFAFGGSMTDSPASRPSRVKTHRGWETWA